MTNLAFSKRCASSNNWAKTERCQWRRRKGSWSTIRASSMAYRYFAAHGQPPPSVRSNVWAILKEQPERIAYRDGMDQRAFEPAEAARPSPADIFIPKATGLTPRIKSGRQC